MNEIVSRLTRFPVVLNGLHRLTLNEVEDDGSGTLSGSSSPIVGFGNPSDDPSFLLTSFECEPDWENSANSSDPADSGGDEDMKDYEKDFEY